jgi:hypothetical protein
VPTPYDEQPDLDLVAAYLAARGLSAERFSPAETQRGKTPDFRVRRSGAIVAYCEVKSPLGLVPGRGTGAPGVDAGPDLEMRVVSRFEL